MGVLLEAISVIVRVDAIEARYPGGLDAYEADRANNAYCSDGHLTRVGFMRPQDAQAFVERLQARSRLRLFDGDAHFADIAIVNQVAGLSAPCSWLRFGLHFETNANFCFLRDADPNPIVVPDNWAPKSIKLVEDPGRLQHVETVDGLDTYLDPETGEYLYQPTMTPEAPEENDPDRPST